MILLVGAGRAQVAVPAPSPATSSAPSDDAGQRPIAVISDDPSALGIHGGKVGLVRGVVKRLDPIHDQLVVHAFGGKDVRIAFDGRTQLLTENASTRLTSIPTGSVVSVDTVIYGGKLFARSVRTGYSNAVELNGQVVRYDAGKAQLTLRDPLIPENLALRVTASTTIVNRSGPSSLQALSPGMLVRVQFSPTQHSASNIEILAERGNAFTFEGRIVAVDLRSHVLALSNDSDQSVRELAIGSLDGNTLGLLREGADVSIQAEFDGDRYNARSVTVVPRNP
jgi:hypothetical protein